VTGRRLQPKELRRVCDPGQLPFRSTAELPPVDGMIGQQRAVDATAFGIAMKQPGYNLFVLGPARTGKATTMHRVLAATARDEPIPADHCYVLDFADPSRPRVLALPAGRGHELRVEMARLVAECRVRLPRAFESEEFERRKSAIADSLGRHQREEVGRLEEQARRAGFAVVAQSPGGLMLTPAPHGEPLTPEAFAAEPAAVRDRLKQEWDVLHEAAEATGRKLRELEREARAAHEQLVREIATSATRQLIQELRERFASLDDVRQYLDQVEADLIAHAEEFGRLEEKPPLPFVPPAGAFLERYRVNVLVDRTGTQGAPVVFEPNPTYKNLLGRVEHHVQFGTLVTDFTLVKPGALHRANGGYLILEALDLLRAPFAWEGLKKALQSRAIRIEEPLEELRASTVSLAPEPIPLGVKVVLIGSPLVYYLLHAVDEDFRELFKVKVDFDDSLPRTPEFELLYARFVAAACYEEALRGFSPAGVAKLVEHGSRLVADQARLTSRLGDLLDVVREAAFWAGKRQAAIVDAEDVVRAIAEKRGRENLVEERIGRLIAEEPSSSRSTARRSAR
jgi:hypothetical protein